MSEFVSFAGNKIRKNGAYLSSHTNCFVTVYYYLFKMYQINKERYFSLCIYFVIFTYNEIQYRLTGSNHKNGTKIYVRFATG